MQTSCEFWNTVNNAIIECLTIGPFDNWDYKAKLYSKYSKKVSENVLSILTFALQIHPNWQTETYDQFLNRAHQIIKERYGHLKTKSVDVLVSRLSYDWK